MFVSIRAAKISLFTTSLLLGSSPPFLKNLLVKGVSPSQLRGIELKAMQTLLATAIKSGEVDQQQSEQWMQQFQSNPPLLEKVVVVVFSVGTNA